MIRRRWLWFAAWAAVGAAATLGLLSILSIGILVLVGGGIGTAFLLARAPGSLEGLPGAISGVGLPLLYVAWLNRSGPGTVCHAIRHGSECDQEWNPAPFWAAAAIFILGGGVVALRQWHRVGSDTGTS